MQTTQERFAQMSPDKQARLAQYEADNRACRRGQIVFAGSSLREMFPTEEFVREMGVERTIYNRGVGGFVTGELLQALDVCIFDLAPARLFINIGTNDLTSLDVTVEGLMEQYEKILAAVQDRLPEVEIYMMAYYPVNEDAAPDDFMRGLLRLRNNGRIDEANRAAEKLAARRGARFVDLNAPLRDAQGRLKAEYTIEGMHITETGYRALFPALARLVREPAWPRR